MATFEVGNMWSVLEETDLWLFTANSYVRNDGELVMGRGLALAVKKRYPLIPKAMGDIITKPRLSSLNTGHLGYYGIACEFRPVRAKIGAFQVKRNYRARAELAIIGYSCVVLKELLKTYLSITRVDLNFPGIGFGKLQKPQVLPIVSELPDFVHIWEFG